MDTDDTAALAAATTDTDSTAAGVDDRTPPPASTVGRGATTLADGGGVTGPHVGTDRYGRLDHRYWRCEVCGLETTRDISDGCPRCRRQADEAVADGGVAD